MRCRGKCEDFGAARVSQGPAGGAPMRLRREVMEPREPQPVDVRPWWWTTVAAISLGTALAAVGLGPLWALIELIEWASQ